LSPELKLAIADTLEDLQLGLLPMGAGSGRGTSLVKHDHKHEWLVNLDQISEKAAQLREADHA
jgi:hypothetical protein